MEYWSNGVMNILKINKTNYFLNPTLQHSITPIAM